VLLAKLFRDGVESLLEDFSGITVIGGADNGKELLSMLEHLEPDIVILDIEMPVMSGHETLIRLRKEYPTIRVIALSNHYDMYLISEFLERGAAAYLPKNVDIDKLVEVIQVVFADGQYLDKGSTDILIQMATCEPAKKSFIGLKILDENEVEVIRQMGKGLAGKQIADKMGISQAMVVKHKTSIKQKTNTNSIAEIILYGVWNGIIPLFDHKER
jgi:DNA-binding NarL/FixJ family response regulator